MQQLSLRFIWLPWFPILLIGLFYSPAVTAKPPNILLIVSEDNGPELGCYGDPYARTPHLDQLAEKGVRFENAFVPYSVCSPSRACFLTGKYPHQNGQIGLATHKFALYSKETPNFVTLLKKQGYHTGLIGKLHVNPETAFPFDYRAIRAANFNRREPVTAYASHAAKFFTQAKDQPWFLSVNFPDAHLPFIKKVNGRPAQPLSADDVKPLPWVGVSTPRLREQVANYYNCLARLDTGVGLLLNELDQAGETENTLIFYIGDHGAQFPRGKGSVYEGGLRVPLIVSWRGNTQPGLVRKELTSTLDLLPTALAAAGMQIPEDLPGRDLKPLFTDERVTNWREYIFGFTTGSFPRNCYIQHSLRDTRFKLISNPRPGTDNLIADSYLDQSHPHFVISGATAADQKTISPQVKQAFTRWSQPPRYELYDLQQDPYEWNNLADDPMFAATKSRLINTLTDWQQQTRDPFLDPVNLEAFVKEQLDHRDMKYRKQKDFRWSYLDSFANWRAEE
ncbi:sulfatase family protein [Gimesia algae]|uniref:Arylsulfatase n=1 Tax=Gimesia algae TaxID=2527971 RepID=A0A517VGS6_9PLAN|nr:sulfatase [Gimesia algae]QDT92212.1 Arylsulfatase [Gimesia algae]